MADHKFVYTVSGVDLSEGQKTKISQAIAAAVTGAIIGESAEELRSDYFTINRVYGGRFIPTDFAEKAGGIQAFFNTPEGCQ